MSGCWRALGSLGSLGSLDTPEVLLVLVVVMLFMIPVIVYVLSVAQLVPRVDGEAKSLLFCSRQKWQSIGLERCSWYEKFSDFFCDSAASASFSIVLHHFSDCFLVR